MKKILSKIVSLYLVITFIFRNFLICFKLKKIKKKYYDAYYIDGANEHDLGEIFSMYASANNGNRLSLEKNLLYKIFGKKLCFVAKDSKTDEILGFEFYYFNKKDVKEKTVHQGFRYVKPSYRNKGVASNIVRLAVEHFSKTFVTGISSRVSLSNIASLRLNQRAGFIPIEKYYDKSMMEERYYLILWFKSNLK